MKTALALILPILALAIAQETHTALGASVNIPVTYRGYETQRGTNAPGPSIGKPIKPASPGSHSSSWRKDPTTNRLIPVFQVGVGENLRMLSLDELKTAAEAEDTACQKELSYLYETGVQGVGIDPVQAYKWAALSEAADPDKGQKNLRRLELFMKPTELEQAKKAVADFQAAAAKKKESAVEKPKTEHK